MQNTPKISIFAVLTLIAFLASNELHSQNSLAKQIQKLKKNVVAVRAYFANGEDEKGFGFIIREQSNQLYIVTAAHIVRGIDQDKKADSIRIKLYNDRSTFPWKLVDFINYWDKEDLALLKLSNKPPLFDWERDYADLQPHLQQKVRFIGVIDKEHEWMDPGQDGTIGSNQGHLLKFYLYTVNPGTSGAPLISEKGIVGMIFKDDDNGPSAALKLERILELLNYDGLNNYFGFRKDNTTSNPTLKNLPVPEKDKRLGPLQLNQDKRVEPGDIPVYDPVKGWIAVRTKPRERLDTIYWKDSNPYPAPISSTVRSPNNDLTIPMVKVAGGFFSMGCTNEQGSDCEENEKPVYRVYLNDFSIGRYEVTQAQWRAVMGSDPPILAFERCDQCPVQRVSWNDIQRFIQTLNSKTGKKYRLPTEAEWEYAARGGNQTRGYKYSGSNVPEQVACFFDNLPHPVGQKRANELGLYDMSGNVLEWCQDWYGPYTNYEQKNPLGPILGAMRVYRGGSWSDNAKGCRVSKRGYDQSFIRAHNLGFRLAL